MASFAHNPADIIIQEAQRGQRSHRIAKQPNAATIERIVCLLRRGVRRGIVPQWTLRTHIGVQAEPADLTAIAEQLEAGYLSGTSPIEWRVDVYL